MLKIRNDSYITELACLSEEDFLKIKIVDCSYCTNLKNLPLWPNVEEVICDGCTGLTELPLWLNVKKISCCDNNNLINLPLWSKIEHIDCRNCNSIIELPLWQNIKSCKISNCINIKQVPKWTTLEKIECINLPKITSLYFSCVNEINCSNCILLVDIYLGINISKLSASNCPLKKVVIYDPKYSVDYYARKISGYKGDLNSFDSDDEFSYATHAFRDEYLQLLKIIYV